jgi:hypothetical protein
MKKHKLGWLEPLGLLGLVGIVINPALYAFVGFFGFL